MVFGGGQLRMAAAMTGRKLASHAAMKSSLYLAIPARLGILVRWLATAPPNHPHTPLSPPPSSTATHNLKQPWWQSQAANALTGSRLVAAPLIAHWIGQGQFGLALGGWAAAAATDAADGYVARRLACTSTLGSYLDPVADKILIGCSTVGLGLQGIVPWYAAAVVVGRDALLLAGGAVQRVRQLRSAGEPVTARSFFDLSGAAPMNVRPMLIGKVNTTAQLAMVGAGLLHGYQIDCLTVDIVSGVSAAAAATTCISGVAYMHANVILAKNPLYGSPERPRRSRRASAADATARGQKRKEASPD